MHTAESDRNANSISSPTNLYSLSNGNSLSNKYTNTNEYADSNKYSFANGEYVSFLVSSKKREEEVKERIKESSWC